MTYAGLIVVLLPEQVAILDPARKVDDLAVVTSISSLAAILVLRFQGLAAYDEQAYAFDRALVNRASAL
ncbi:hypothetical protein [Alicyclobacillus fructus]|uniref:hypothetical protein n=1 Tax=Alicyclobacillus fructus TaxID=2816082 RepID=UPI001A8F99D5|nr:hypothetical protein [Alicyclobacillus fructus]